jgi:hypothetical protein
MTCSKPLPMTYSCSEVRVEIVHHYASVIIVCYRNINTNQRRVAVYDAADLESVADFAANEIAEEEEDT